MKQKFTVKGSLITLTSLPLIPPVSSMVSVIHSIFWTSPNLFSVWSSASFFSFTKMVLNINQWQLVWFFSRLLWSWRFFGRWLKIVLFQEHEFFNTTILIALKAEEWNRLMWRRPSTWSILNLNLRGLRMWRDFYGRKEVECKKIVGREIVGVQTVGREIVGQKIMSGRTLDS